MTGRPHHFSRTDANQAEIVAALRELGFCVIDTSPLGGEALDLFVGGYQVRSNPRDSGFRWLAVEVKQPGKRDDLTDGEREFFRKWPNLPAVVAESIDDVLAWFGQGGGVDAVARVLGDLPNSPEDWDRIVKEPYG